MLIRKFQKISAYFLIAAFYALLVACTSGVEPTSGPTHSPTVGDAAVNGPTNTASATITSVPTGTSTITPSITPTKTATATPTPLPVENQIAFFEFKNNEGSIYRMNPDGSGLTRLVNVRFRISWSRFVFWRRCIWCIYRYLFMVSRWGLDCVRFRR